MTATTVDAPELVAQEYALMHAGIECRIFRRQVKPITGGADDTCWVAHVGRAMSHATTTLTDDGGREESRYVVTNARFRFDPADVVSEADALERARSYCAAAADAIAAMREQQLATWTDAEHGVELAAAAFSGEREVMH